MREQDKPFVMYRRGPWNFTIVPRGKAGWTQFGVWMAVFADMGASLLVVGNGLRLLRGARAVATHQSNSVG